MKFILTNITGLDSAMMALKMSKRHWNFDDHMDTIQMVHDFTNLFGQVCCPDPANEDQYKVFLNKLNLLAKWGAGVGNGDAYVGDGHETLLRFIDFTFITEGLHRGAQDDLDSHAARFNNRIVRSSTRLSKYAGEERSDWYNGKILSTELAMARYNGTKFPERFVDNGGTAWVHTPYGYTREDLKDDNDTLRGNYPLSIPSTAIWKINLYDMRHVYMRRNNRTTASPELQEGIEQLADQIEDWLPCDLGKLIRYDYAKVGKDEYKLVHIHDIQKVYNPRDTK